MSNDITAKELYKKFVNDLRLPVLERKTVMSHSSYNSKHIKQLQTDKTIDEMSAEELELSFAHFMMHAFKQR